MNTQEKEPELGEGVTSAEFWAYDGKLGRRWNVDPVYKVYDSPYACFGNNPILFIDPNGADTINVFSKKIDANGKQSGETGFNDKNMLFLFKVHVQEQTKPIYDLENNIIGYEDRVYKMLSSDFLKDYSLNKANSPNSQTDGMEDNRVQAEVITVNNSNKYFSLAIGSVSTSTLEAKKAEAKAFIRKSWQPNWLIKFNYFNDDCKYDIKKKLCGGMPFTYIPGVGLYESDFIGNVFYGSVWADFQTLQTTLHDGDFAQKSGTDDAYDSYGITLGNLYSRHNFRVTLASYINVSMSKTTLTVTNNFGGLYHFYEIIYLMNNGNYKTVNLKTSN
jgi:hypothetical protein